VTNRKLTLILVTLLNFLLCSGAWAGADPNLFPRPKGLEPAVQFWTKVFTKVTTDEGYIHDDWYLDVIYSKFTFDRKLTRRQNQKRLQQEKKNIIKILHTLSSGQRSGLSSEEKRILALWPSDVSNSTLRSAMDRVRFQLGQADKFKAGLIRSGRWRPFILENLKKMGMPREIAALPHVESSFNPKAYSHVGAAGLWQFTRSTGRRFLRIDHIVDERMDPFKASVAAAQLLQNNYDVIGTWPLAMTAYNHGAAGMRHAAKKMGTTDIEYIIKNYKSPSFKFASRNFYTAFLAVNDIQDDYQKYFGDVQLEAAVSEEVLKTPGFVSVNSLAKALGISKEELQEHNPALRPAVWNNSKLIPKGYEIRLRPGSSKYGPEQALARIDNHQLYSQQKPDQYHRVRRGQTLSTIAARYGVSVRAIASLNNIRRNNRIRVGQVLRLPQRGGGEIIEVASVEEEKEADNIKPAVRHVSNSAGTYKVRRGDSIIAIARKFGLDQRKLMAMNGLSRRKPIYPGQTLKVREAAEEVVEVAKADPTPEQKQAQETKADDSNGLQVASITTANAKDDVDGNANAASEATADSNDNSDSADNIDNTSNGLAEDDAAPGEQASEDNNDADKQPSEIADTSAEDTQDKNASGNSAYVEMIAEYLDNSSDKQNESIDDHMPAIDVPGADKEPQEEEDKVTDAEPNVPAIAEEIDQPVSLEPPQDAQQAQAQAQATKSTAEVFPATETPDASLENAGTAAANNNKTASVEERTEAIEEESAIAADPTDYTVSNNHTIEVQASETLGHYADWLGVRASSLRRLNRMRYRAPLVIGKRLKLDFRHVSPEDFVKIRVAYHRSLQEAYFEQFEITGSERHRVKRGESLYTLAKRKYKIPVWLFRQYNPDLAFNKFKAGITVTFPSVKPRNDENSNEGGNQQDNADNNKMANEPQTRSGKRSRLQTGKATVEKKVRVAGN